MLKTDRDQAQEAADAAASSTPSATPHMAAASADDVTSAVLGSAMDDKEEPFPGADADADIPVTHIGAARPLACITAAHECCTGCHMYFM